MGSSLIALFFDFLFGEPPNRLHPTVWMGNYVAFLERLLYRRDGDFVARALGSLLVLIAVGTAALAGFALEWALLRFVPAPFNWLLVGAAASLTIAARSLAGHALPVLRSLCAFDMEGARKNVAMIVGRDTASLGRGELSRAGVEAVAESLGDGVVAPLFWFAVFGLPGAFAYRISNTMDSMIGHKDERYLRFGWAAARFDDLLNYLPTRLMGFSCVLLAALCAKGPKAFAGAARAVRRCHAAHKSPNAGWYEAAFAGALGIRLGGVNYYCGERIEYPLMNPEGTQASPRSLREAVSIMLAAAFFSALLLDLCVLPLKLWLGGHI